MKQLLLSWLVPVFFVLASALPAFAQDARLAQQYFANGEYEKAASMYEKLYQDNNNNDFYFERYFDCMLALERFAEAEAVIQKQLRKDEHNVNLYVSYGVLLERRGKYPEAEEKYTTAIQQLPADQYSVIRLANSFINQTKYPLAVATFERGAALLNDQRIFAYNLGDLYRRMGEVPKMIEAYLNALSDNPERLEQIQTLLQRSLSAEDFRELQTQLYGRIQTDDNNPAYPEMLAWVFIQQKDYRNALRQMRALDLRYNENGNRVFELGGVAANDRDYATAIAAFDYIVNEKGPASTLYLEAKRQSLNTRRLQLVEGYSYTAADLEALEQQYLGFLGEIGYNRSTASIILELADLYARYLNDLDKAIELLTQMIDLPGVDRNVQAQGKLALADYYLMTGDIWESTLLYSQVDKAFKEDPLGHEARFRNARLSYFNGDFQWAQAQFEVLKTSTSKLIANDALDLSVFIMDNLGLDTTAQALQMYADAELLVFRNLYDEAFGKMDSLLTLFPEHTLLDDVLYLKGVIHRQKREYPTAVEYFQQVVDKYKEDIRADNALFALAEIYELHLNDLEKAKELYETLFIDFSNSTFAVEARKRFRKLRGDNI